MTGSERGRFVDRAPRRQVSYECSKGHTFILTFAANADPPATWDCRSCGRLALTPDATPPQLEKRSALDDRWDLLLKRRSVDELEGMLAEALQGLRAADQPTLGIAAEEQLAVGLIDGRLRLLTVDSDGRIAILDPDRQLHQLVYVAVLESVRRRSQVQELEELVNSRHTSERDLQSWFEAHPDFLIGDTYEEARPHLVLERDDAGPLIPDFALKPANPAALCDLMELKMPSARLLAGRGNRRRVSAALLEAAAQLREYRDYFESAAHREAVEHAYGLKFFRPRMYVVIGRRSDYLPVDLRKAETDLSALAVVTYDDLLARMRRHTDRPR